MIFYFCLLVLVLNIFIFRKNKKMFVICSFMIMFILAALRKYTVGIDLRIHYANSFLKFGDMAWDAIIKFAHTDKTYYDSGLIYFMKFLYLICGNVQFFIISTSAIIYGLIGRYIYLHSKNVYVETILFFTTYTYFMYMNIIAQAIAIAIMLLSIDYLEKKSYIKFTILILIANFIHSSAIICLIFIPMRMIRDSKKNIKIFSILSVIIAVFINFLMPFVLKYIFPQFAFYFTSAEMAINSNLQLAYVFINVIILAIGLVFNNWNDRNEKKYDDSKLTIKSNDLSKTNFFFYMTIFSILLRFLAMKMYMFSRIGFYFYMFAYSLLAKSIEDIKDKKQKVVVKFFVYILMITFFFILYRTVEKSYGVVPYYFYWQ